MTIDTMQETAMNEIVQATKVLSDLEARRDGAVLKTEAIANRRRLVAYAASTGDAAANRQLEALKRQRAGVSSEIETLEFAINVARQKLRTAEQTQAAEVERENKKNMLKRAEALRSSAAQLDNDAGIQSVPT